ncbi:MAG: glycosyltransferase family 39 protein [Elusimicrobiota bacterium]
MNKLILALALTTPLWDLGHPLWEVDDARYAEVPREMAERGDWLSPTLDYVDYIEKPPLIYWLSAASYRLLGTSEAAARLPLALLSILGMLGAWWLAAWLYGPAAGPTAAIILGTGVQYFALSHFITPDMALSVFLLWATGLALRSLRHPEDCWAGPLAWVALAGGVLSKGPVAFFLAGLWVAGLAALFPDLRKGITRLAFNWGTLVFAAVIGSWFIAMEASHPGFTRFFVVEQNLQRYLTPEYNRPGPWYYFFTVEFLGPMPWTPLILPAVLFPLLRWRASDPKDRQLALWVLGVFAFFTLSKSKLLTYILPLFPHQAVLAAGLLSKARGSVPERWAGRLAAGLAALFVAGCAIGPFVLPRLQLPGSHPWALAASALVLLGASAAVEGSMLRSFALASAMALCADSMVLAAMRCVEDRISVRSVALEARSRMESARARGLEPSVICYDTYVHGIAFYTGGPVDLVNWVGELYYAKRLPRFQHRFGDDERIRALPQPGRKTFVVSAKKELPYLRSISRTWDVWSPSPSSRWALLEY